MIRISNESEKIRVRSTIPQLKTYNISAPQKLILDASFVKVTDLSMNYRRNIAWDDGSKKFGVSGKQFSFDVFEEKKYVITARYTFVSPAKGGESQILEDAYI